MKTSYQHDDTAAIRDRLTGSNTAAGAARREREERAQTAARGSDVAKQRTLRERASRGFLRLLSAPEFWFVAALALCMNPVHAREWTPTDTQFCRASATAAADTIAMRGQGFSIDAIEDRIQPRFPRDLRYLVADIAAHTVELPATVTPDTAFTASFLACSDAVDRDKLQPTDSMRTWRAPR